MYTSLCSIVLLNLTSGATSHHPSPWQKNSMLRIQRNICWAQPSVPMKSWKKTFQLCNPDSWSDFYQGRQNFNHIAVKWHTYRRFLSLSRAYFFTLICVQASLQLRGNIYSVPHFQPHEAYQIEEYIKYLWALNTNLNSENHFHEPLKFLPTHRACKEGVWNWKISIYVLPIPTHREEKISSLTFTIAQHQTLREQLSKNFYSFKKDPFIDKKGEFLLYTFMHGRIFFGFSFIGFFWGIFS